MKKIILLCLCLCLLIISVNGTTIATYDVSPSIVYYNNDNQLQILNATNPLNAAAIDTFCIAKGLRQGYGGAAWSTNASLPILFSPIDNTAYSRPGWSPNLLDYYLYHNTVFEVDQVVLCNPTYNGVDALSIYSVQRYQRISSGNFTASPLSGNAPLTVSFILSPDVNPYNLLWDFGDTQIVYANTQNMSKVYSLGGLYDVTIVGTLYSGTPFAVKRSNYINVTGNVTDSPTANFVINQTNYRYAPSNITHEDKSYGNPAWWNWHIYNKNDNSEQLYYSGQTPPLFTVSKAGQWQTDLTVGNKYGNNTKSVIWGVYNLANVTPITPNVTSPFPIITGTPYPTVIPTTLPIVGKNTVFYTVKDQNNNRMPNVGIQQWQYKCNWLDILCLFGAHPEQIDGGYTDYNGNFMAVEDSPASYDYKIGGNLNQTNWKTYSSSTGSFSLPPDKYITAISNLYGFNTTLYIFDIYIYNMNDHTTPISNVNIKQYEGNNLIGTMVTDSKGEAMFLVAKGNYTFGLSRQGYYDAGYYEIVSGAAQRIYYLNPIPVTSTVTTKPITTLTGIIPITTMPISSSNASQCRYNIDMNNETFISPFINVEACVGIVNPVYQNLILSAMITIIAGILLGKKQKNIEGFLIGAIAGNTVCLIVGLINIGVWVLIMLPFAAIYVLQKENGGKK